MNRYNLLQSYKLINFTKEQQFFNVLELNSIQRCIDTVVLGEHFYIIQFDHRPIIYIIIIIIRRLNVRRMPMYHLFPTRRVSQLLGLALVSWAFASIGVHRPSLCFPYLVFSICSYLPLDFNRVSSLGPSIKYTSRSRGRESEKV